jgi:protein SCO1/2
MSIAKKKIIILTAALAAAMAIGIALANFIQNKKITTQQLQAKLAAATLYPDDFRPLAAFRLTDHNGQTFDNDRLTGHWNLLSFGFTYCPDVCPLTMQVLQNIGGELSARAGAASIQKPRVIFISVDPERDTVERLQAYVGYFDPDFIGVSGDHENLKALAQSLGVFYSRAENPQYPDRYQVDHSASLFLLDPNGKIRALFSAPLQARPIANDLLTILQHG